VQIVIHRLSTGRQQLSTSYPQDINRPGEGVVVFIIFIVPTYKCKKLKLAKKKVNMHRIYTDNINIKLLLYKDFFIFVIFYYL